MPDTIQRNQPGNSHDDLSDHLQLARSRRHHEFASSANLYRHDNLSCDDDSQGQGQPGVEVRDADAHHRQDDQELIDEWIDEFSPLADLVEPSGDIPVQRIGCGDEDERRHRPPS